MARAVPKDAVDAALVDRRFTRYRRERDSRIASQTMGARSGERRNGHGWRRTARDERMLQFVTLHGMVMFRQAAKWFYNGVESTASSRISKMCQAGLLNRDDGVPEWAGMVLTPTPAGQRVGVQGLPPMFDRLAVRALSVPDNLLHAALVADRMLVAESQGFRVLTERQIRMLSNQDPADVRDYLSSDLVGVKFAASGDEPGVRAGRVWKPESAGPDGSRGVLAPHEALLTAAYPGVGQRADTREPSSIRVPDFIQVHPVTGELIAVEVEIAAKANDRLEAIIAGYSDAIARAVPDEFGGWKKRPVRRTNPKTGETVEREEIVMRRAQFRQVRWLCVPESARLLRGTFNPSENRFVGGYIARAMPAEYGKVNWNKQSQQSAMIVEHVTADDIGVQYQLDQRVLHAKYRCSYKRWRLWRTVWESDVPPDRRGILPFTHWLMLPGAERLEKCLRAERDAADAVPPRRGR